MEIIQSNHEFSKLISQHHADLTRLCYSLCRNHADAEDLYQDTWLKAMKNYGKYDKNKSFDKWLFAICVNTYKDNVKSSDRKRAMIFADNQEKENFFSQIPDNSGSHEEYTQLLKIIEELPEKYKIVIVLRYFRDYSEKDVANILKIPQGTVKSRLNKAKKIISGRFEV